MPLPYPTYVPGVQTVAHDLWIMETVVKHNPTNRKRTERHFVGLKTAHANTDPSVVAVAASGLVANLTTFLNYRRTLLAADCAIVSAVIKSGWATQGSFPLISGQVGQIVRTDDAPTPLKSNLGGDEVVLRRHAAATGHVSTRGICMIRDADIAEGAIAPVIAGFDLSTFVPGGTHVGLAPAASWQEYMYQLGLRTFNAFWKNGKYNIEPWGSVSFIATRTKSLGFMRRLAG